MPSDVFKYIPAGMAAYPGTCRQCGSNQRDMIDTGLWFEYEGAILYCTDCIMEVVNVDELKIMRQADAVNLMVDNERLLARDKAMTKVRKDLRDALVAVCDNIDWRVSGSVPERIDVSKVPAFSSDRVAEVPRENS